MTNLELISIDSHVQHTEFTCEDTNHTVFPDQNPFLFDRPRVHMAGIYEVTNGLGLGLVSLSF